MSTPAYSPKYLAENHGGSLTRTCIILLVVETVFMILFFTSRYIALKKKERVSLVVAILTTATYIACVCKLIVIIILVAYGGTGRHYITLDDREMLLSTKLSMVLDIICPLTTSLSKLGVLCLYSRIFGHISRAYRVAIRVTFVLVVVSITVQILVPVLNCRPYSWNWYLKGPLTCKISPLMLFRYQDLPNLTTTLIAALIPIPGLLMLRSRFSRAVQFGLVLVILLSTFAVTAAILRFIFVFRIRNFDDISFTSIKPLQWAVTESGLNLMTCICMTLRPLLSWAFKGSKIHKIIGTEPNSKASTTFWSEQSTWRWFRSRQSRKTEKECSSLSDGTFIEHTVVELHRQDGHEKC